MSTAKSGFNPWIATVILGVVTILFSLLSLQSQTELISERKQVLKMKNELELAQKTAEQQFEMAERNQQEAVKQYEIAVETQKLLDECKKSSKKR
jgi:hypothetical protein